MIPKGTKVTVKTTNGGEATGTLARDYVPSYGVDLDHFPKEISPWRVKSVVRCCTVCGDAPCKVAA